MAKTSSALLLCLALCAAPARGQSGPATSAPRHLAAEHPVTSIVLVKAADDGAVVRAAARSLETVRVGDLVGRTKAVVKEVSPGRVVLEENFTGKDGKPN